MTQTAVEKAENLINKFGKELAPKVVCEITDYLGIIEQKETSDFAFGGSYNGDEYYDYWQKVNQEMLKIKTNNMENETFEEVVKPLMKWLCENKHPHTTVIVTGNIAELVEGLQVVKTDEFIVD